LRAEPGKARSTPIRTNWKRSGGPRPNLGTRVPASLGSEEFALLSPPARTAGNLFAAAGRSFHDGLFDRFTGFASSLLNAAQQLIMLAVGESKIVIRKLGSLLFQLAFGDVPVALDFECVHSASFCFSFVNRRQHDGTK
jgi:hypothetical protein